MGSFGLLGQILNRKDMTHYHDFEIENERLRPLREEALKLHFEYLGTFKNVDWIDRPNLPSTEEGLLAYIEKRKLDIAERKQANELHNQRMQWVVATMDKPASRTFDPEVWSDLKKAIITLLFIGVVGMAIFSVLGLIVAMTCK